MDLSKIVSIVGKPGLYKLVGELRTCLLVESIDDGKRFPVHSTEQVSSLQDICIFCTEEEMPLGKVMDRIFEYLDGKEAPAYKSDPEVLKDFFDKSMPDYDKQRVYTSDIKKVIRWYNILLSKNLLIKEKESKEEESEKEKTDSAGKTKKTTGNKKTKKAKPKPKQKKNEKNTAE